MAAVSLFWNTNIAAVTSYKNALYGSMIHAENDPFDWSLCKRCKFLMRSFGQNPNPDFETKNEFSVSLDKSKKDFKTNEPILRTNSSKSRLKSKRYIGNEWEKKYRWSAAFS